MVRDVLATAGDVCAASHVGSIAPVKQVFSAGAAAALLHPPGGNTAAVSGLLACVLSWLVLG